MRGALKGVLVGGGTSFQEREQEAHAPATGGCQPLTDGRARMRTKNGQSSKPLPRTFLDSLPLCQHFAVLLPIP